MLMDKVKDIEKPERDGECASGSLMDTSCDMARYLPMVDGWDITEGQKKEYLEVLWHIALSFVDIGFGLDPVQNLKAGSITASSLPDRTCKGDKETLRSAEFHGLQRKK